MSDLTTIVESYTLPSKGKIYDKTVNPVIKLRSMTTAEEMKRLAHTETPYKSMCDIIDDCIVGDKPGISVYDMCIGDYQFLLHKLRIVTYGPEYKITLRCPNCGEVTDSVINLEDLELLEYDSSIEELKTITLPVSGKVIELKVQTPRVLDSIELRTKELQRKRKDYTGNLNILVTIESLIKTVDGEVLDPGSLELFVTKLPMKDANILVQTADKLNKKVGLDTSILATCSQCGYEINTTFRITSEFFGPTI